MLLLKDGRISIGHTVKKRYGEVIRETGIEIYGQTIYNKIMFIKGLGPYQTELKDGNLLIGSDNVLSVVKLNKKTYDVLQNIKTGKIKNTIELREPAINTKCGLIIEGKPSEVVIYLYNDSDKKYELMFFDYEKGKMVKSLNINNNIATEFSLKLSDNMIAFPFFKENNKDGYAILLVDCIKREIIKNFEINRVIPELNFYLMTLIDKKTLLLGYSDRNRESNILQYKVGNDDLEYIDEKKGINIIGCRFVKLSGGKLLVGDHFDGELIVYS